MKRKGPPWEVKWSKPKRKPRANPFRRWSVNGGCIVFDEGKKNSKVVFLSYYEDADGHVKPQAMADMLNRARVVLPKAMNK